MRVIMLVTAATVVWFNISEIVLEFPALVTPWFQVLNFYNCADMVQWFNASLSVGEVPGSSPEAASFYKCKKFVAAAAHFASVQYIKK